jgi:2-keto-4-pentenoate hydratase/2-oxohepta-3-ene-1,7-dioic acid hydratase in catechol pathway
VIPEVTAMRLAHFHHGTTHRLGVVVDDQVNDLGASAPELPADPLAFLAAGPDALDRARQATERTPAWLPLADVRLLAPVPRPGKLVAMALNYRDHLEETGMEAPTFPTFFTKQSTCVVGPGDDIEVPRVSDLVDYEGELAVVIGTRCRHVAAADALSVVAGYTIVNDVTVRDWQMRAPTMMIGKSFDTHGPMGPWLVTADELPDPQSLGIRTTVNGQLLQDGNTKDMIFDIATQIETLSTAMTLEPGDVISTGTPAGVGIVRQPPVLLRPGDTVRIEIEGIGALENPVVAEPAR